MKNIGFVEKNDDEKTKMIKFLVDSAKGINLSKMTKEEDPMNETTEDVVKNDDVVAETEVAPEADATTEVAEEAADVAVDDVVEEVAAEEPAVEDAAEKADTVASEEVAVESDVAEVSKSEEIVAEAVAEIRDGIATAFSDLTSVVKSLNDEITELKKSLGLVNAKLNDAENDFNNIGKRIDAVEADTAFRKSGDLGEIVQEQPAKQVEKSLWGGRFLKTADLFN
jgi:chromosome segregation ATPase